MALGDYTKTGYNNNAVPAINAPNLNNNEDKTEELDTQLLATNNIYKEAKTRAGGYLDNAGFEVQQFVETPDTETYDFDRWEANTFGIPNTATISRVDETFGDQELPKVTSFSIQSVATLGNIPALRLWQKLPSSISKNMEGLEMTFSFYAKVNIGDFVIFNQLIPQNVDDWSSDIELGTANLISTVTGWVIFTKTYTIPSSIGAFPITNGYAVSMVISGALIDTTVMINRPRLEIGSVRTNFVPKPFQDELFAAQFYVQKLSHMSALIAYDDNQVRIPFQLSRELRKKDAVVVLQTAIFGHGITAGSTSIFTIWDGTGSPPSFDLATIYEGTKAETGTESYTMLQGLYVLNGSPTAAQWLASAGFTALIDARL